MPLSSKHKALLDTALDRSGQRSTRQRELIFGLLLERTDHPTADEIYASAREEMSTISLATVYNCLDTLVETGLIRQVNFEREPSRFCPNLQQHAHFYCRDTGEVRDIDLPDIVLASLREVLPEGYRVDHIDISFSGKGPRSTPAAPDTHLQPTEQI